MARTELRVHGVSGTPPADMLYTGPVTYDQSPQKARVYETSKDRWDVKAFHWGSLTAGHAITALWILLAPFAMVNASGWMSDTANKWTRAFGRLTGLSLTAIFFAQITGMTLDAPYQTTIFEYASANSWMMWLFVASVLSTVLGLGYISTQSTFRHIPLAHRALLLFSPLTRHLAPPNYWNKDIPAGQWEDPADRAVLTDSALWSVHAVLHRIRRLHLAGGMATLSLAAGYGLDHDGLFAVAGWGALAIVVVLLLTTWAPTQRWLLQVTAILPIAAVCLAAWATYLIATADLTEESFQSASDLTFQAAVIFGASAILAMLGEWASAFRMRRSGFFLTGWTTLGTLAIALLFGASLGLAGTYLVEVRLTGNPDVEALAVGGAWTALAMLGLVVLLLATMLALGMWPLKEPQSTSDDAAAPETRTRRVVLRARILLGVAGVYGIGTAVVAVLRACDLPARCSSSDLTVPDYQLPWDLTVSLFGFQFDLGSPVGIALLLVVVVPALLIARSIINGLLEGQDARRQVGILWDIGSFWPRWHHPLGPPAYGPNAVTRLEDEIAKRRPTVVGAHSQGSLISAVALAELPQNSMPVLFVTYGSQLGILYPMLFPSVGFGNLVDTVDSKLGGRWLNLWRRSDPVGGHYVTSLGGRNWHVMTGAGHSRYELTPEYCAARQTWETGDLNRPTEAEMADCWERMWAEGDDAYQV